jgi:hypothetical protein
MRILRFLSTGTALAVTGVLTLLADPASAASARTKANQATAPKARAERCTGLYEAAENGACVHTKFANPDRSPQDFTVYYRSTGKKHKTQMPTNS